MPLQENNENISRDKAHVIRSFKNFSGVRSFLCAT
jgi:hypothetical protein